MSTPDDLIYIRVRISKKTYDKLKEQIDLLQGKGFPGLEDVKTVEELIEFYLGQFSVGEEHMKKLGDRMHSILETLKDQGIDILDLFKSFEDQIREKDVESPKPSAPEEDGNSEDQEDEEKKKS